MFWELPVSQSWRFWSFFWEMSVSISSIWNLPCCSAAAGKQRRPPSLLFDRSLNPLLVCTSDILTCSQAVRPPAEKGFYQIEVTVSNNPHLRLLVWAKCANIQQRFSITSLLRCLWQTSGSPFEVAPSNFTDVASVERSSPSRSH